MPHPGEKCLAHCELIFQGRAEPRPRVLPVSVGNCPGKTQCLARFLDGEPPEQVDLSDPRCSGVFLPESGQQFVQRQDEIGILGEGTDLIELFQPQPPAGPLQSFPIPRMIDQDPPHGLSRGGEEVAAAVEVLIPDQPQVGFVDQSGRVEGVADDFGGHFHRGQLSQLVVEEREQFRGGLTVAVLGSFEEVGDFGHAD